MMCFIGFIVLATLEFLIARSALVDHKRGCADPAILWNVDHSTGIAELICTCCSNKSQEYRLSVCFSPYCWGKDPIPSYENRECNNPNCMKEIENGWNVLMCNKCTQTYPGYWLAKMKCPHCNTPPPSGLAHGPDLIRFP
ncbi:hypothetical protein PGTUg99_034018 [Puccinia graminis f. sp. tritici]|uniref:Uncharacterized protein n=1 Tax=Puccinia graminis f. sp. tritici TaxID=56615 RepID=A0A5B0RVL4_PUCGR|nr:hypothetical protein PGTUg99_034018 [Puccinia graminis f. sp. tritici]